MGPTSKLQEANVVILSVQLSLLKPGWQAHVYDCWRGTQRPALAHGRLEHTWPSHESTLAPPTASSANFSSRSLISTCNDYRHMHAPVVSVILKTRLKQRAFSVSVHQSCTLKLCIPSVPAVHFTQKWINSLINNVSAVSVKRKINRLLFSV